MKQSIFIIFLIITYSMAGNIDYYKINKIIIKAKKLPYLSTRKKKGTEYKRIKEEVNNLNETEKEYIKEKLKKIYKKNKEIEFEQRQQKMFNIAKKSNKEMEAAFNRVKKGF